MVTILPQQDTFGSKFGKAFSENFSDSFDKMLEQKKMQHQAEALGVDKRVLDPILQRALLDQSSNPQDMQFDQQAYDTISKRFGPEEADLYRSATEGGKTSIINKLLENEQRNKELNENLGTDSEGGYKLDTRGMTPKEKIDYKSDLRKYNDPIWKEAKDKLKSSKDLHTDIKILRKLNDKKNLPEGFSKLLINPETGAPYDVVTSVKDMHPDVQRWVKTIARQATQAQSAFPGRVTNFDLQSYMRQFPGLFNTTEGRKVILDQMDLINQGNELYENALNGIYEKYNLNGITPEDAHRLAREKVNDKLEKINEKIVDLSEEGELLSGEDSNPTVQMLDPQGNPLEVPRKDVEKLKALGAKIAK